MPTVDQTTSAAGGGRPASLRGRDRPGGLAPFDDAVQRILRALRTDLGFDVAFVSQLRDGARVFRYVDTAVEDCPVRVGGADPAEESYCHYVVTGALPELLRDARRHPVAARLDATEALPVGTHVAVPIRFSDGTVYGTFCCFGSDVRDDLHEHALVGIRAIARVVGDYLEEYERDVEARDRRRAALLESTAPPGLVPVYQPIVDLGTRRVVAVEALARFPGTGCGPAEVFAEAWELGVGVDLEVAAATAALDHGRSLPHSLYLSVNASPGTLTSAAFLEAVRGVAPARLVVEVTEHAAVDDYEDLLAAVGELAGLGVRLAIDDVGMGFSGLNHILRLDPHILKLDAALVRDVDAEAAKQALVAALVAFAARTDVVVVAEGIETAAEVAVLSELGIRFGQGYYLGRPGPLAGVLGAA